MAHSRIILDPQRVPSPQADANGGILTFPPSIPTSNYSNNNNHYNHRRYSSTPNVFTSNVQVNPISSPVSKPLLARHDGNIFTSHRH
jgi:hypothetical protein